MKAPRHKDLQSDEQDWLDAWLDGTISDEDFGRLQNRMMENPTLRSIARRYQSLDISLQTEVEDEGRAGEFEGLPWTNVEREKSPTPEPVSVKEIIPFPAFIPIAAAAALAFFAGIIAMQWMKQDRIPAGDSLIGAEEPIANGFAVIERLFDVTWSGEEFTHREGDMLGREVLKLVSGTAEVQFFSGATMTVEGPAEISLKSAWEAVCAEGAVRMQVPPAARGFRLHTADTEIVDLGTEFGLVVRDGQAHVEVIDGEIEVSHQGGEAQLMEKGAAMALTSEGSQLTESGAVMFPDVDRFGSQSMDLQEADYRSWLQARQRLLRDDRLIAWYDGELQSGRSMVSDLGLPENPDLDGAVILAGPVSGRWSSLTSALEFRKPGSRVRVNIPGEFSAFTFTCWVRIDSLDRRYNALFMGDGYENGEPHWQIRDDGMMMLSVMVDTERAPVKEKGKVGSEGLHRVYFSPPMWDISQSGQWMHLTSVFDPEGRQVSHYVNGRKISTEKILPKFEISTLRIGNGEIGNWGQPFREDPTFAIRNLNGRVDELGIFQAALSDEEVQDLYEQSRSDQR